MRQTVLALAILAALAVPAASRDLVISGASFQKMYPGMTEAQVEDIVGRPEGFRSTGNQVVWSYLNKCVQVLGCAGIYGVRTDFHVIFTNGILTEVGSGEIRQNEANVLYIYGF